MEWKIGAKLYNVSVFWTFWTITWISRDGRKIETRHFFQENAFKCNHQTAATLFWAQCVRRYMLDISCRWGATGRCVKDIWSTSDIFRTVSHIAAHSNMPYYILSQDFVKSRSCEIRWLNYRIAFKVDGCLGSATAETFVKCQNDWTTRIRYLQGLRFFVYLTTRRIDIKMHLQPHTGSFCNQHIENNIESET